MTVILELYLRKKYLKECKDNEYPVSQFSSVCPEILQPLLSSHLATTRNSIEYFKS